MSSAKINMPIYTFNNNDCDILFKSITEKLNIQNPTFYYPIYNSIISGDKTPDEMYGIVFNSKFKCKQILSKVLDCDSEDYETDSDQQDTEQQNVDVDNNLNLSDEHEPIILSNTENTDTCIDTNIKCKNTYTNANCNCDNSEVLNVDMYCDNISGDVSNVSNICDVSGGCNVSGGCCNNINNMFNTNNNIDTVNSIFSEINNNDNDNNENNDDINEDEINDNEINDDEINDAINNTFMANALIESIHPKTGKPVLKSEIIHIKKTALLEPLKLMQDEYVCINTVHNKNLDDKILNNTKSKLNDNNNCGYVESLFLYLGNKLVETGKCPSFPHYYGCVVGDDPNYHHNITDEYESVSNNKWFRNRIKLDFDLLIIRNNDTDDNDNNTSYKQTYNSQNSSNNSKTCSKTGGSRSGSSASASSGSGSSFGSGSGSMSSSSNYNKSLSYSSSETSRTSESHKFINKKKKTTQ